MNKRAIFFSAVVFLLLFILFAQTYIYLRQGTEVVWLSKALNNARVSESVSIAGTQYAVRKGTVYKDIEIVSGRDALPMLRLAYEKTLARRDPLISLSGTDPATLREAVQRLADVRIRLADFASNEEAAAHIRTSLYPIDFLSAAADLEHDRQVFLSSGSREDARIYEATILRTINSYRKDINMFRKSFTASVPATIRSYTAGGILIDRTHTIRAIDALARAMEDTEREYRKRLTCLHGSRHSCDTTDIAFPLLPTETIAALPAGALATAVDIRSLWAEVIEHPMLGTGPLIQLSAAACTPALAPLFVVYSGTSWASGTQREALLFVGDIRFNKTEIYEQVPFEHFFGTRGVEYMFNDPLSHYTCLYRGSDYGRVFGVLAARGVARERPLSAYVSGDDKVSLEQIERALASTSLVRESDAFEYVTAAEHIVEISDVSDDFLNETASLALTLSNRTAGFAQSALNVSDIEYNNLVAAKEREVPIDLTAETLFYLRSAYIMFFMGDNPSVVENPDSFFPEYRVPRSDQPYVFYTDLLHTSEVRAELIRDIQLYFNFHMHAGGS